jgi:hypothetical protein
MLHTSSIHKTSDSGYTFRPEYVTMRHQYMHWIIFRFLIPVVFYANEGGWVRQNTTVVGSYVLV